MKLNVLFAILLLSLSSLAQTLIDTSGGRYWNPLFPNVTVTSNVLYGSATNVNNAVQNLSLDVYEPTGDTVLFRPLLVFAHGGSFIFGTKNDQDVTELCTRFAKMGYVCASIDYRLGMGLPLDSINAGRAVIRATQDLKAAIRFFRKDFAMGNNYRIHPDYIFAGGSSAGAFTALHLAYMDSAEVPPYLNIANLGGIDGASGNPGYPSNVLGVINLCGALTDSSWIQPGDISFVSMHGNVDQTVPYGSAMIFVFSFPIAVIDGSASLHIRATNVGVNNPFYTWWGADHVPYSGTGAAAVAYMDTTVDFVKAFLRPYFGIPPLGILETDADHTISIYPNPATNQVMIHLSGTPLSKAHVWITDAAGRNVALFEMQDQNLAVDASKFAKGMYILRLAMEQKTITRKLILE